MAAEVSSSCEVHNAFSNYVCLLSLCGPTPIPSPQQNGTRDRAWCQFLDDLAWMCDYRPGGKSVTSVAAELKGSKIRFWMANNDRCGLMAARHLSWVLERLQIVSTGIETPQQAEAQIFERSIRFSRTRVMEYANTLHKLIGYSRELGQGLPEGTREMVRKSKISA